MCGVGVTKSALKVKVLLTELLFLYYELLEMLMEYNSNYHNAHHGDDVDYKKCYCNIYKNGVFLVRRISDRSKMSRFFK
jgi:hypothetical protein